MEKRPQPERDVLPAKVAERVLARASELDAARAAGMGVADLRAAAAEAGISAESFDAALGEVREANAPVPLALTRERRLKRFWSFAAGLGVAVLLAGAVIIPRLIVSAPAATSTTTYTFPLSCVGADAIELVKPLVGRSGSVYLLSDKKHLAVRATPEAMENVKAALSERLNACVRP